MTKTEFLPTISIQNQENKKREKEKYKFKGLLVDPLPNSQDYRQKNEILVVKRLTDNVADSNHFFHITPLRHIQILLLEKGRFEALSENYNIRCLQQHEIVVSTGVIIFGNARR